MNGMRMHGVSNIKIQKVYHKNCQWYDVTCTDKEGNDFSFTFFSNDDTKLEILPDDKD
jgi:4-hydroxy-3-methylbut-2-enyl diphosphate reductase IspH